MQHQSKVILYVDDEPSVLLTARMLLEAAGYQVFTAETASEALKVAKESSLHAAVLDYWLPGLNGIQLAHKLKEGNPFLPIVFVSAFREFPGETLGLAEAWFIKGEDTPDDWLAKLHELTKHESSTNERRHRKLA